MQLGLTGPVTLLQLLLLLTEPFPVRPLPVEVLFVDLHLGNRSPGYWRPPPLTRPLPGLRRGVVWAGPVGGISVLFLWLLLHDGTPSQHTELQFYLSLHSDWQLSTLSCASMVLEFRSKVTTWVV